MDGRSVAQAMRHAPAGPVTFLLTDVEGPTGQVGSTSGATDEAAGRQNELFALAIARYGGVPLAGYGAAATFTSASDALLAALDVQRVLRGPSWPDGVQSMVRAALHAAHAQPDDEGNDFGDAANRCARLRAIAHGGQVVMSRTTYELIQDRLPDGADLLDLGIHRLPDLGRPEHVFALRHPDLPSEFAPQNSVDAQPNNLPTQVSSFVGRARELAQVREALNGTRLLTLTGSGGSGKTRLAVQAAAAASQQFPDGVWLVELGALADPALVAEALATTLGVRAFPGTTPLQACCAHLAGRCALVILDNCEHVLDACREIGTALLTGCPEVTVLATSRARLGLPIETDWPVPGLSLPTDDGTAEPITALECDAVRLFTERARKVAPNFTANGLNLRAVVRICRELDGIPLAIELATGRLRMLSATQIADALVHRFRLLTGGSRTALPRHQTLRASVDWSYDLLDDRERILFRRLGVFAGGFTLDAAETVAAGDGVDGVSVLDLLGSLVDNSLVLAEERGPVLRYRLLETVRQYALECLDTSGEGNVVRDRHRDAFLALAEQAAPHLESALEREWLDPLDVEAANFAGALDHAAASNPERALRLAVALTFWWRVRGRFAEAEAGYARALAAGIAAPTALCARALAARAQLGFYAGDYAAAAAHGAQALVLAEAAGDGATAARALIALGRVEFYADPGRARPGIQRAVALAEAHGDTWAWIEAVQVLALTYVVESEHAACERLLREIADPAQSGWGYHRARQAFLWGRPALFDGRYAQARAHLDQASAISDELGEPIMACLAEAYLCILDTVEGTPELAHSRALRRLEQATGTGAGMTVPYLQLGAAYAESMLNQLQQASDRLEPVIPLVERNDVFLAGQALALLSNVQRRLGATDAAHKSATHGLEIAVAGGNRLIAGENHLALARLAAANAEWESAERHVYTLLDVCDENQHDMHAPGALEALAEVAAGLDSPAEAARLLGAAERACRDLGMVRWRGEDGHWLQLVDGLRARLGEASFEEAWAEGGMLSLRESMGWARRSRGHRKRPAHGWESLTPTESEVVRHVAAGLTNPQIGERLFISRATVKVHLSHVFAKLDIASRAQLAAEATRRGVVSIRPDAANNHL